MLKPWRVGSRLTEDAGLGEPAMECGSTSRCFSSPLEQTAPCHWGHAVFLCSGRCTLSLGFNSCPFFCGLESVYFLTCLQSLFQPHVKLTLFYVYLYLCTPFSWDSQGYIHTLFVRICRKRGVLTLGCRIASRRSQPIVSRPRKPIVHCVPAPQSPRKT